jgi:DNA-binding MarR family transcriptional regulator
LVARTYRTLRNDLYQRLRPLRVTFEQFQVLLGLSEGDDIPQHVLADRMSLEPSSMTRMLSRMEKRGLIKRVDDEEDSRVRRVLVTEAGHRLWEKMEATRDRQLDEVLRCLADEEINLLKQLLNRLYQYIEEPPENC